MKAAQWAEAHGTPDSSLGVQIMWLTALLYALFFTKVDE